MPASSDVAFAGQSLRIKCVLAFAQSAVVPLLTLAYVTQVYVLPGLHPTDTTRFYALQLLMLFTLLAMVSGGYIIWDLGRTIARLAEMFGDDGRMAKLEHRKDEVGTLMQSFAKMLETIEQQAAEINSFASRLDQAYKELESTNARLQETSLKDAVTGLYNTRFFSIRLEEEMQRHRRSTHPVSVVPMDLDAVKAVNAELA